MSSLGSVSGEDNPNMTDGAGTIPSDIQDMTAPGAMNDKDENTKALSDSTAGSSVTLSDKDGESTNCGSSTADLMSVPGDTKEEKDAEGSARQGDLGDALDDDDGFIVVG